MSAINIGIKNVNIIMGKKRVPETISFPQLNGFELCTTRLVWVAI